jgi:hypothetical protein
LHSALLDLFTLLFFLPDLGKLKFYKSSFPMCTHFPLDQRVFFHQLLHTQLIIQVIWSLVMVIIVFNILCWNQVSWYLPTSVYFLIFHLICQIIVDFLPIFFWKYLLKMISILLEQQRFVILNFLVCWVCKTYCPPSLVHWWISRSDKIVLHKGFGFLFLWLWMPLFDDIEVLNVFSQWLKDFRELRITVLLWIEFFELVFKFMKCGLERDNFDRISLAYYNLW